MKRSRSLLLANYLYMAGVGLLSPIYALYVLEIKGDEFIAGASWSLYLITAGLIMLFFGKKEDLAKSYKPFVTSGYFIASLSTFMYLIIDTVPQLFLLQIIHAVGIGLLTPSLRAAYTQLQDKKQKAHEWALFDGGLFILQGVAAFTGGALLSLFGFTSLFIFMGTIQVFSAIIVSRIKI